MNKPGGFRLTYLEEHPYFTLVLIILIASILRLIAISSRGIWYDDAFSILLSKQSIPAIISGTSADTMPPLYYFILHYWMMVSQSIWFIRLLNVILSLLVIYLVYRFGTELGGGRIGLVAAFLTAISPFQIYHAQEIRMYILLEIGCIGYFWMSWRLIQSTKQSKLSWVMLTVFGAIAVYSHNLAVFTLIATNIFLLIRREWKKFGQLVIAQGILAVGFLPWLVLLPGQIEKIQKAFWTPQPGVIEILQALLQLLGSMPQPNPILIILTVLILQVIIVLAILVWKRRKDSSTQFFGLLIFLPPFLLFVVSYLMRPIFVPRAFITSGLGIYLLLAMIGLQGKKLDTQSQTPISSGIINLIVIVLISIISLPYQYQFHDFPRSPYQRMTNELVDRCDPSDCLILHDTKLSYFPMIIYNPELPQRFLADSEGSHNDTLAVQTQKAIHQEAYSTIQSAVDGATNVYFITYEKALSEYEQMGYSEHPRVTELNAIYTQQASFAVGDLLWYEFAK